MKLLTSASELAKFIRSKCSKKYSNHPLNINPSARSIRVESITYNTIRSISSGNIERCYISYQDFPYFKTLHQNFKIQLESIPIDFRSGVVNKITLKDDQFSAETDIFWTNYLDSVVIEVKDANWDFDFANIGDIAQISVFSYLTSKITGINPKCYIYYSPNNKLFQISPMSYEDLIILERKYNYGTSLDLEEVCRISQNCICFEGTDN